MSKQSEKHKSYFQKTIDILKIAGSFFMTFVGKIFKHDDSTDRVEDSFKPQSKHQAVTTNNAKKHQVEKRIPKNLLLEIEQFDKSKLKKQHAYFVSSSLGKYPLKLKTHGFSVLGNKGTAEKKGFAEPYYLGASVMHAQFNLTDKIIQSVQASKKIKPDIKKCIETMEIKDYPSVEHFLRELLSVKARLAGLNPELPSVKEEIFVKAANPDQELRQIVVLNTSINGRKGAVLPKNAKYGGRVRDRELFETNSALQASRAYPNIEPDILRDVFQQQLIYTRYMEEKAGIGKATDTELKIKKEKDTDKTAEIINNLVHYKMLSGENDPFSSNCNKATANLLQIAENRSAEKQGRKPEKIKGASIWSIGTQQRLFLWEPLKPNFNTMIYQLIEHNKTNFSKSNLQVLADNKRGVLHIVSNLPKDKKIHALEKILNSETMLGKIFRTPKTGTWFAFFETREYLWKASKMLAAVSNEQIRSNSASTSPCK